MERNNEFIIVDANNILLASILASKNMITDENNYRLFIHIMLKTIFKICRNNFNSKSKIILVFDRNGSKRKTSISSDYKADRKKLDEPPVYIKIFSKCIKDIEEYFPKYLNIPIVFKEGIEADDFIYYMSNHLFKNSVGCMVSNDKDYYPFTNNNWILYRPLVDTFVVYEKLIEKYKDLMDKFDISYKEIIRRKHAITGTHNNVKKSFPGVGDKKIKEVISLILEGKLDSDSPNFIQKYNKKYLNDAAKKENQDQFKLNMEILNYKWIEDESSEFNNRIEECIKNISVFKNNDTTNRYKEYLEIVNSKTYNKDDEKIIQNLIELWSNLK